jgi:tRNA threonylcarbamoyladenosine biosynthesis protein TsaB
MPGMNLLALETSTDRGSCALWQDGLVSERVCPAGVPHSQTLLPLVRDLMRAAGLGFAQLDGIAFGAGPGAFTGLRVACGVAQGLAVAAGLPVVPVSGLAAMAAATGAPRVLALLDARMGEVYVGAWRRRADDGEYELDGEIRVAVPADVHLPVEADWLACGNAPAAYPLLAARLGAVGVPVRADILPGAAAIAAIAAATLARGEGVDPALAAPLYVRDKVAKTIGERLGEGGRA